MGQKTNPNILRLGKTKEWKSKYIEKNTNELFVYTYNYLELKKFIKKFFEQNGLTVSDCKISSSENSVHIFLSYFCLPKAKQLVGEANNEQKIKIAFKKRKSKKHIKKKIVIKNKLLKYNFYTKKHFSKQISANSAFKGSANRLEHHYFFTKNLRRLGAIKEYKKYKNIKHFKNIIKIKTNLFINKLFESISLFLGNNINISISLKQLNNNSSIVKTFSKKKKNLITTNLLKLRKFQRTEFFKTGVTLLYICVASNESHKLVSQYIAFYLKTFKRHKFFLSFLKSTLKIFLNKNFSKIKRIKILIKGRFNGAPRAKKNAISIGIPPSLTLNSDINYSESTSFTTNGTFGIKVWTYK